MAASTNIYGFNIGGNNNSFDQRGHFYRAFLDGNVSGMLVKQNSTPSMTVLVEHGSALLNKNTISASVAEIKSDTSVTIDTANTSNPRIDTVVIYEDTSVAIPTIEANYWQDGSGGRFKIVSLPGTAAASPNPLSDSSIQTAIGAGKPWARLANITVPANSTTIINSNINNSVRSKLGVSVANINGGTTAGVLTTDASGNVTSSSFMPSNQYKFSAYRNAALNSASIDTAIAFDTELFDTNNNFDVTTNKGRYTVPVTGYYWFNALAGNTAATATPMRTGLMVNGVLKKVGNMATPSTANNRFSVTGVLYLTAGQYVEATYIGGGGSVMAVGQAECYFEGFLVSAS